MDSRAPPFEGVRFFLLGFDPITERQVRSKLLDCGGTDVGIYSPNCTHIIVDRITYDHPVCGAARKDGKTVVTALWVHHTFDVGMPLDAAAIIYRPLKHLNGIPGAKNLLICLTGYQGQDRDDIMTMVALMGAQFSKPLVASRVTHLICYKFEGEKYKLAKQLPQIKIVNHRWLEDCLKDWVLLQEDNYNQSGYELEIMEAEARDSEDEAEDTFVKQSVGRSMIKSCHNLQAGSPVPFQIPKSEGEVPMVPHNSMEKCISRNDDERLINVPHKIDQASKFSDIHVSKEPCPQDACKFKGPLLGERKDLHHTTPDSKMKDNLSSAFESAEMPSPRSDRKHSYSRQSPWKSTLPLYSGDKSSYGGRSSRSPIHKLSVNDDFASSSFRVEENEKVDSNRVDAVSNGNDVPNEGEPSGMLPQKRTPDQSYVSSKLQKTSYDAESSIARSASSDISPKEIPASLIDGLYKTSSHYILRNDENSLSKNLSHSNAANTSGVVVSPAVSPNVTEKSLTSDVPSPTTLISEIVQDGNANKKSPLSTFQRLRKSPLSSKPGIGDLAMEVSTTTVRETVELQNLQQDIQRSSPMTVTNLSNNVADLELHKGGTDDLIRSDGQKMKAKKTLGSRLRLTSANQSVCLDEGISLNVGTVDINAADQEKSPNAIKPDLLSPDVNVEALEMAEVKDVTTSVDVSENRIDSLDDETEAPEEEDQHELESIREAKTSEFTADIVMKEKSERVQHISNDSNPCVHGDAMASGENMQDNEQGEAVSGLVESTSKGVGDKEKKSSGRNLPFVKNRLKSVPAVNDKMISEKDVSKDLSNHSDPCVHRDAMASVGNMQENEQGEPVSVQVESISKGDSVTRKKNSQEKGHLIKSKLKTVPAVSDEMNSEKGVSEDVLNHSEPCVRGDAMASVGNIKENEQGESVPVLVGSTSKGDGAKGKKNNGKKRPLGRTKLKTSPVVTETESNEGTEMEDEGLASPIGKSKCHNAPKSKPEDSSELKENRLIAHGDQNINKAKQKEGKSHVKCNFTPMGINQKLAKISRNSSQEVQAPDRVSTQPEWFILSGHQFERKEFQQIIKRLKGRCCRDSHNWSYQATHFIIPEPIRRIEKFFAAAASGRWILKSDYLAASNQAGKFVAEEPYEWYKSGLSEDGTINLEAPRKWRLLRERTGHGAFHGMRIIIYGDCIAPRLDTLKRVMKAGDGTILATCPPYTRFLNSGVDFAIVSPGMPRVDMWVQEFLKHEIPCVVADYLVEYVCKPGYPLERHVLYNTHAWAEKSFGRLQSKAEEVLVVVQDEEAPMEDSGSRDIPCVICGSCDRGEVMLICGNESGSVGCGIGTHIDCCSPPLEDIPEDDWFCPKCCSQSKNTSIPSKKRKKGKSK